VCGAFRHLEAGLTEMLWGLGGKNVKFCLWSGIITGDNEKLKRV